MRRLTVGLLAGMLLAGCTIPTGEEPAPTPLIDAPVDVPVAAAVTAVTAGFRGTAGLAVVDGSEVVAAGEDAAAPAWSTIKVPLAIAALRGDPGLADTASAAIRVSDNDAAEVLWTAVGAEAVDAVLAEGHAGTAVARERLRSEYSIAGQTAWAPSDQARFAAHLPCLAGAEPVLADMAMIDPTQAWGLGTIPGARFKGGWGPDPAGIYTARQFGLVPTDEGAAAVALTVTPQSGTFEDAQAMATALARELVDLGALPTARCG